MKSCERLLGFHSAGTVEVLEYPSLQTLQTLVAHTAGCYCIAIDPTGRFLLELPQLNRVAFFLPCSLNHLSCLIRKCLTRMGAIFWARYLAVGSADALVSLWDVSEMLCVRTFTKLE